ncbi:MAG: phosphate-starvation-inducible PsiE family protein [Methanoregula sp.]|jgi:uncharacterized membrane protein (DUF373 family)
MMLEFINRFEKLVYILLIAFLVIVLVFAIGQMFFYLWTTLTTAPVLILDNSELSTALGGFLLVLIAVELLDTMKAYITENVIHVEVVVLLAIIAIARKVILLSPSGNDGLELIGIGIIIVGLAASYYLIRKAGITIGSGLEKTPEVKQPEAKPPQTE